MKDKVIELWMKGWSSGAIALELGLNRNKVMGHVWRAQKKGVIPKRIEKPEKTLPKKFPKPHKKVTLAELPKAQKPIFRVVEKPVEKPEPPVVHPPKPEKQRKPKTILELGIFDCRYILDDGRYCGQLATNYRQPWCSKHRQIVYYPAKKKA